MYLQAITWINEKMNVKHLPQTLAHNKWLKKKATVNISNANKYNKITLAFALCEAVLNPELPKS